MAIDVAQGMLDQAFSQSPSNSNASNTVIPSDPLSVTPPMDSSTPEGPPENFSKQMFGVDDPSQILQFEGEHPNDPNKVVYTFAGDGKRYAAKKDTPVEQVLENIWDKKSPGLWGAAKAQTLYGLPADASSAIAYGLGGMGLSEDAKDWRGYSDKLKEEYRQKYGQYMVPGVEAAIEQGKVWDYALQALGTGAPYMGLALAGGAFGIAGTGAAGFATTTAAGGPTAAAMMGSFLGSTAITSPVTIAQFADRQVAQMREQGVENPESKIDWASAAGLGTLASGLQAVPVESILFGGPLLKTLASWGVPAGSKTSARMLASVADIAGTNALASAGAAFLSRTNADMPLLDDDAKSEYLDAAIMGSLVGIPFGIYKGIRHEVPKGNPNEPPKPLEEILDANTQEVTNPVTGEATKVDADTTPKRVFNKSDIIFDPSQSYGIDTVEQAAKYLDDISYQDDKGVTRSGLTDFVDRYDRSDRTYKDAEIIDQARRVKRIRELQDHLKKTKNGVLYETINDIPQVHTDNPNILTKAAALADRWGYADEQVRSMSDSLVEKLFDLNLKKELRNLEKSPKEVYQSVLSQMKSFVDEGLMKEVQEYGSLYNRPQVKDRIGKSLSERRKILSKNPRKQLAELLMKKQQPLAKAMNQMQGPLQLPSPRRERAGDKLYNSFLGDQSPDVLRLPDQGKAPALIESPPLAGEAFSDYAGMRQLPLGPRALLEYKPYKEIAPDVWATALDKAANRPGQFVTSAGKLTKKELLETLAKDPLMTKLRGVLGIDINEQLAAIRRSEAAQLKAAKKAEKDPYPEPKLDNDGNPILKKDGVFSRTHPEKPLPKEKSHTRSTDVDTLLKNLRDRVEQVATQERRSILEKHPELRQTLDILAKKFAELSADTAIPAVTKSVKGAYGLMESLARRASILGVIEKSLANLSPKVGALLSKSFERMIVGDTVSSKELSDVLTILDTSFSFDKKGVLQGDINVNAVSNLYKTLRSDIKPERQKALDTKRSNLDDWYATEHGINTKDLQGIPPEDIEANAFYRYLKGDLRANFKKFKGSPQQKYFEAIEKSMKRIQKELGDQGYKKSSDILEFNKNSNEPVPPEAQRPTVFTKRVISDLNNARANEELPSQSNLIQSNATENQVNSPESFDRAPKGVKEPPLLGGFANNVGGPLWKMWDVLASIPAKARQFPAWAAHYQNQVEVQQREAANNLKLSTKFSKLWDDHGWPKINEAAEILAFLRKTEQKVTKDEHGRVIYTKDGITKALTPEASAVVDGLMDFTKEVMRMGDEVYRGHLNYFKEEGLDKDSSLQHVKRAIENFQKKIEGNPFPEERARYIGRRDALDQVYSRLQEFDQHVQSDVPYIPFMRFGDYVVQVVNRKTGDTAFLSSLNDQNIFGSDARLPSPKEAKQRIEKMGLYSKYDPKEHEIRHFQMTYDNIGKFIQKGAVSTELLQGLLASGINENLKVADHLATGIKDYKEVMGEISDSVKNSKDRALKYLAAKGVGRFSLKSENIDGHSVDWARVLDSYKNIWAASLAKQSMMTKMIEDQAALQSEQGIPDHIRTQITKYLDYVNSPDSDFSGIRNFSFITAMGFSPASAMLQLATLPNQTLGLSLEYNPNLISNAALLASEMRKAISYVSGKNKDVYGPEIRKLMESEPGHFRASIRQDTLKNRVMGVSDANPLVKGLETVSGYAGMFITPMEQYTRVSTFNFYRRLLTEHPDSLRRALKQREKDHNWQAFWKINKDKHSLETALALYSMHETHAVYGKPARGALQKGLAGSLFFPFTTYAQQMMEVLGSQLTMQRGLPGLYAGLWSMGTFMAMAGMAGIPGYEILKSMYEEYEKRINGRVVDAEMQMKEAGIPLWARKGLISSATGYDVSARLGQDIIGQNILLGLMKGELKTGELGGVPGRTLQNLLEASGEALSETSTKSPMELVTPLLPAGLANLSKAYTLATEPEKMLQTKTGKMLAEPSSIGTSDVVRQGLGFSSTNLNEERQQLYWNQRANQEFNLYKNRLAEGVASARYKMILGSRQGDPDMVSEGKTQLEALRKQMVSYAKENNIPLDGKFWSAFNSGWQQRLQQKLNPGKLLKKPTEGERRHLKALLEDEAP